MKCRFHAGTLVCGVLQHSYQKLSLDFRNKRSDWFKLFFMEVLPGNRDRVEAPDPKPVKYRDPW